LGRAKKKRKAELKRKRERRKKAGRTVSFTLANSPKLLKGRRKKYEYKVNIHNCSFKKAKFENTRYRSGHMTNTSFRNAVLRNTDFISVNLKKTNFKGAIISNCIFFNCDLTNANFKDVRFSNTYFISCKIKRIKTLNSSNELKVITKLSKNNISFPLKESILKMKSNKTLEKYNILTTKENTINKWLISILLNKYSERELIYFFNKLTTDNRKQFFVFNDYYEAFANFYKR